MQEPKSPKNHWCNVDGPTRSLWSVATTHAGLARMHCCTATDNRRSPLNIGCVPDTQHISDWGYWNVKPRWLHWQYCMAYRYICRSRRVNNLNSTCYCGRITLNGGVPYCRYVVRCNAKPMHRRRNVVAIAAQQQVNVRPMLSENSELSFLASLYVVVRPSVCLSSVTFVHPTQAIEIFGHLWPLDKNFTEIVPGEPLQRRVKHKKGSRI